MNKTHRGSRLALAAWLMAGTSLLLAGPGDARLADAVMKGDRDVVRTLIQQKTDVNAAQVDGMTALHWPFVKTTSKRFNRCLRPARKPTAPLVTESLRFTSPASTAMPR